MRDGEYHVRVEGTVRHANPSGSKVTLQFKGQDERSTIDLATSARVHVLGATSRPALTLVTCYPFYCVGHAPQRFIVSAHLVEL